MTDMGSVFKSGIGGATGVIPGAIAASTGAGKSTYSANNFAESPQYDPNKWEYGGHAGVADQQATNYGAADAAYGQKANDLYGGANLSVDQARHAYGGAARDAEQGQQSRDLGLQSRGLNLESRGREGEAQNLMLQRAKGQNLISDRVAAASRNDLGARLHSAAASARGPAGLANAQSDAMAAEAQGLGQINTTAGIQGMQEQRENELAAFNSATGMRSGDTAMQAGDANMRAGDAQAQGLGIQQGQAYGQLGATQLAGAANMGNIGLGYAGRANDVRNEQGTLGIGQQQTLSASHNVEQNTNSATVAANAGQDLQNVYKTAGATEGGANAALQANESGGNIPTAPTTPASSGGTPPLQTSRAKGGPIYAGQEVLVGEKGPEVIVPQENGTVIPNNQLGGLGIDQSRIPHGELKNARYRHLSRQADEIMAQMAALKAEGPSSRRLSSGTPEAGYESELTSGAEQAFRNKTGGQTDPTYDLRGAHAAGLLDGARMEHNDSGGVYFPDHLPDTFKKPTHETFSDESNYANDEPNLAGRWGDGNDNYIQNPNRPPRWLIDYMSKEGRNGPR